MCISNADADLDFILIFEYLSECHRVRRLSVNCKNINKLDFTKYKLIHSLSFYDAFVFTVCT